MNRIREVRRGTVAATTNGGLSRRPRSGGLRYSPGSGDDGPMDAQEIAKLRDHGITQDRARDRSGRNKAKRGNRVSHGSNRDEEENSSEESLEDDDDVEDDDILPLVNLPPSQLAASPLRAFSAPENNHIRRGLAKVAMASLGWNVVDKMIGVPVPRKARSAPGKRHQDCGVSSTSPAQPSPASASPNSPSSSGASAKKKMRPTCGDKLTRPPKIEKPSSIQDIEIEVAEVLFGMTRQLQPQDSASNVKMRVSAPNSTDPVMQVSAPKRKKPRTVKIEEEIPAARLSSALKVDKNDVSENGGAVLVAGDAYLVPRPTMEILDSKALIGEEADAQLDQSSSEKKKDPVADGSRMEKCSIDLMAPPLVELLTNGELRPEILPATGEGRSEVDIVFSQPNSARNLCSVQNFVAGDERMSVLARMELVDSESDTVADDSEKNDKQDGAAKMELRSEKTAPTISTSLPSPPLSCWPGSTPLPQTQSLRSLAPHPRVKRCATHCYVAKNIFYHQQIAKMNPFWPAVTGVIPQVYGVRPYTLDVTPPTESSLQDNGDAPPSKEKKAAPPASSSLGALLETPNGKQFVLQQLPHPGAVKDMIRGPALLFPLNQQVTAVTAGAGNGTSSSSSAANSGLASSGAMAAMNANFIPKKEAQAQYHTLLKNSGYSLPTVPLPPTGGPPIYRGASTAQMAMPFFDGALCYPQMLSSLTQQAQQIPHASSVSSFSSQNHPHQSGITFPAAAVSSTSQSTAFKQQRPRLLPHVAQQPESAEMASVGVDGRRPSSAESPSPLIQKSSMLGQNFSLPILPQNFSFVSPASAIAGARNHLEKACQPFALSFASPCSTAAIAGGALPPGLDLSALAQSHYNFLQSLPEAAQNAYQMNGQHLNSKSPLHHIVEDPRSITNSDSEGIKVREEDDRKLNVPSSTTVSPNSIPNSQQQEQLMPRLKQNAAASGPYLDRLLAISDASVFPAAISGFPPHQGVIQGSSNNSHPQLWKNSPARGSSTTSSPSSSNKNQNPPQQLSKVSPQHSLLSGQQQISFGANSLRMAASPPSGQQQQQPIVLNSPSTSTSKAPKSASTTLLPTPTPYKSSSILGHPHITPASTFSSSKQQQQQLFLNHASYMHSQASQKQLNASAAMASYYQRRLSEQHYQHQPQPGTPSSISQPTSEPGKAGAALPYIQALPPVSVKAAEQKPAAA